MPKIIKTVAAHRRPFVAERRLQPRYETRRSARMFDALTPDADESGAHPLMVGHTRDISETGLAIVVTSDSPDSHCDELVGRELRIELDLPDGVTKVRCTIVRVKQLVAEEGEKGFLLGVRITQMNDEDWVHMVRYILNLHGA